MATPGAMYVDLNSPGSVWVSTVQGWQSADRTPVTKHANGKLNAKVEKVPKPGGGFENGSTVVEFAKLAFDAVPYPRVFSVDASVWCYSRAAGADGKGWNSTTCNINMQLGNGAKVQAAVAIREPSWLDGGGSGITTWVKVPAGQPVTFFGYVSANNIEGNWIATAEPQSRNFLRATGYPEG